MSTSRNIRTPTLRSLAIGVNREHDAAINGVRTGMTHARRCGVLLLEAKQRCRHGKWLSWLSRHCPNISRRSAQDYMRLARRPKNVFKNISTIEGALSLLSAPPDLTPDSNTQPPAFPPQTFTPPRDSHSWFTSRWSMLRRPYCRFARTMRRMQTGAPPRQCACWKPSIPSVR